MTPSSDESPESTDAMIGRRLRTLVDRFRNPSKLDKTGAPKPWTNQEIGDATGCTSAYVSMLKHGKAPGVSVKVTHAISEFFGLPGGALSSSDELYFQDCLAVVEQARAAAIPYSASDLEEQLALLRQLRASGHDPSSVRLLLREGAALGEDLVPLMRQFLQHELTRRDRSTDDTTLRFEA
ncbi:hypothetical protein L3Q67_01835 [Saccharothrix sp. AJ9571]|nr:hypothetical protein L3Q67_01835 [Saccharothrix sp. AJ9571]